MLKEISSSDNDKVKLVRRLASRKGRSEEGLFVAEGINLVSEIIEGGHEIEFIMVSESFEAGEDDRKAAIADYMASECCASYRLKKKIFDKLSDAEHGIELIAVCRMNVRGLEFIDSLAEDDCILVCDRVQDPGNIGTMIRTAVAAGYGALVLMPGTTDVYSPKVLRATAGMVFAIPILYAKDEDELFHVMKRCARRIVVTDPAGGVPYYEEDISRGIALVIGNEGAGISESIMNKADVRVTLPMKGSIESLNAAVAAAVLMYESVRDRS